MTKIQMEREHDWGFLFWFVFVLGTFLLLPAAGNAAGLAGKHKQHWKLQVQPAKLVNGSPAVFRVFPPAKLKLLSGTWLTHEIIFYIDPVSASWYAIAGASLDTPPGVYSLHLTGELKDDEKVSFDQKFTVRRAKYPNAVLTVDEKFTEPSPQELENIQQDKALKQEVFRQVTPDRQWSGGFRVPVKAEVSSVFGSTRTFNGKVQSTHEGLDYAVAAGTPVLALNRGTVVLARPLFYEGNCVVIDHGQGLLTLYLHLSQIEAKEGDLVAGGQEIGRSGATGRATGPHLHLAVRWQGVYLNPAILLALNLP